METIAIFDFDGTITSKDTFIEFIKYVRGKKKLYCGLLLFSPLLIAYKLKLYPNWRIKEKIFSFFFKNMCYDDFKQKGYEFADCINSFTHKKQLDQISFHKKQGHKVYVITASIEEWVLPWCKTNGIDIVLATLIEKNQQGLLTGKFSSKNCYGQEKVNRFLKIHPKRENYILYAYGDSNGDAALLKFSDYPYLLR